MAVNGGQRPSGELVQRRYQNAKQWSSCELPWEKAPKGHLCRPACAEGAISLKWPHQNPIHARDGPSNATRLPCRCLSFPVGIGRGRAPISSGASPVGSLSTFFAPTVLVAGSVSDAPNTLQECRQNTPCHNMDSCRPTLLPCLTMETFHQDCQPDQTEVDIVPACSSPNGQCLDYPASREWRAENQKKSAIRQYEFSVRRRGTVSATLLDRDTGAMESVVASLGRFTTLLARVRDT